MAKHAFPPLAYITQLSSSEPFPHVWVNFPLNTSAETFNVRCRPLAKREGDFALRE